MLRHAPLIQCKTTNAFHDFQKYKCNYAIYTIYIYIALHLYYTISGTTHAHLIRCKNYKCNDAYYYDICVLITFTTTRCVLITLTTTTCVLITVTTTIDVSSLLVHYCVLITSTHMPTSSLANLIRQHTSEALQVTYVSILHYICHYMLTSSHAKLQMLLHLLGTSHMYICIYTTRRQTPGWI